MPRFGGGERCRDRLLVAHLAHQDYVGVLAQGGPQTGGEGFDVPADLALVDQAALGFVEELDRILECDDVAIGRAVQVADQGVERALRELPDSYYTDLQASYQDKRDQFCAALRDGGFRVTPPQGAYYVMANYKDVLGDLEPYPAVLKMIETMGMNGVPGDIFYEHPKDIRTIRFQFAVDQGVLDEVCQRIVGSAPR